jgi:type 1 glutamine amidotransferase
VATFRRLRIILAWRVFPLSEIEFMNFPSQLLRGFFVPFFACLFASPATWAQSPGVAPATKASPTSAGPIRVLLITGGCCHDYDFQSKAMQLAAKEKGLAIDWTVVNQGGNGTRAMIDFYKNSKWSEGFDVVIHNECFADTDDPDYIRGITKPHFEGVNAIVIHCAMHTYRSAKIDDWREFLGVTSRRHDHQSRYPVTVIKKDHPIVQGIPADYTSAKDELYIIEKVWPNTTVLATSKSEKSNDEHAVFWTNHYGKGRVFGTTYGHSNETFSDKVFLDTLVRGIQWAAGK